MNKSNTEKDNLIFSYTNNQTINLPVRYIEMIEDTLAQERIKSNTSFPTKRRVAIIILFFVCIVGTGAYASSNFILKRQEQLSDSAIEQYAEDIQTSGADADAFSRNLSQDEMERLTQLENAYKNEGVFPERDLLVINSENEINQKRVCFLAETSTFYLPKDTLKDEDLLEIIDFHYIREYSLSIQETGTTEQTPTDLTSNLDTEEIATQMIASLFNINMADLLIQNKDVQTMKGDGYNFSQEHISILNQTNQIQYNIVIDLDTKQVSSIDLINSESNYADGFPENVELEQSLYSVAKMQNEIFVNGQYVVKKCFIQALIDDTSGNLQHGIVNYCFELDHNIVSVISYSYATQTFYQYRMFTQEGFEKWKKTHTEKCKERNLKFIYKEIK